MKGSRRAHFLVMCLCSVLVVLCLNISMIPPATAPSFILPCQIQTYGDAWKGVLAFGLFENFSVNTLSSPQSYLVVMETNGTIQNLRITNDSSYWAVKPVEENVLMFLGEPGSFNATHLWNWKTNQTTDFPTVWGHHDIEYNPTTKTFLTLRSYSKTINGTEVLFDSIVELNATGAVLWQWDTDQYFNLNQACRLNDTWIFNGKRVLDLTHCNSLQWDYENNIIYLNVRDLNTFCKINKATGQLIWSCGGFGNFTLLDSNGNKVSNLWYHSHALKQVEPNVFEMFDNDFHNQTDPNSTSTKLIEITVNEANMTAWVSWSWTAPPEYWTPYWGEIDRLPNGDRLGTFGTQTHNIFWNNISNSSGAVLVEVNPRGEIVRTWTFPNGWGIYRALPVIPLENSGISDKNFTINIAIVLVVAAIIVGLTVLFVRRKREKSGKG